MELTLFEYQEVWRFCSAFCCGVLLTLTGSLIQGVTQNELAGPSTLGLNAIGVFFVLLAHGLLQVFPLHLSLELFSFCLFLPLPIGLHCWWWIKFRRKNFLQIKFGNRLSRDLSFSILIGLCLNLLMGALFSILQFVFMTLNIEFPTQLWYGNFRYLESSWPPLIILMTFFLYAWGWKLGRSLRTLSFGPDFAASLGVPIQKVQWSVLLLALYAEALTDSFFGIFSFVGIIFPHLLRALPFFSSHLRKEIVYGPWLGGLLLATLDFLCQHMLFYGAEIPVGMVTSLVGTLALLGIILKRKRWKNESF